MPSDTILLDFDGPLAIVSNNRPEKHNAANDAMDARLWEILEELHHREGLRAVVWRGNGASFSSGRDTSELGVRKEDLSHLEFIERGHRGTQLFFTLSAPIVVALKGWVIGGSFERALLCDLRVAGESARMRLPEILHGVEVDIMPDGSLDFEDERGARAQGGRHLREHDPARRVQLDAITDAQHDAVGDGEQRACLDHVRPAFGMRADDPHLAPDRLLQEALRGQEIEIEILLHHLDAAAGKQRRLGADLRADIHEGEALRPAGQLDPAPVLHQRQVFVVDGHRDGGLVLRRHRTLLGVRARRGEGERQRGQRTGGMAFDPWH